MFFSQHNTPFQQSSPQWPNYTKGIEQECPHDRASECHTVGALWYSSLTSGDSSKFTTLIPRERVLIWILSPFLQLEKSVGPPTKILISYDSFPGGHSRALPPPREPFKQKPSKVQGRKTGVGRMGFQNGLRCYDPQLKQSHVGCPKVRAAGIWCSSERKIMGVPYLDPCSKGYMSCETDFFISL